MSAIPVINNLLEARKLLEIVTGVEYPELSTRATINNALAMHRALMLRGFRYRPPYHLELRTTNIAVERNDLLDELRIAGRQVLALEQALLSAKLEATRTYFRKGVIVYSHYVDGMLGPIRHYIENLGLSVGVYSGGDKSGLQPFLRSKIDVLVASSPVGTGLDGLQTVCDRLVVLCLPWTGAEYEQIIGRIWRQGSRFGEVEIVIPCVTLDHEGNVWSWDQARIDCIQYKRTLSDCALDGFVPETVQINHGELLRRSREALERWIARIELRGPIKLTRQQLTIPLPPDIRSATQRELGDFSALNQRWSTARGETTHARLKHYPTEWYLYHTLYREQRAAWSEQPFARIASCLRNRPDWIVGDFGCGECLLAAVVPNRVIGIDHVAAREDVLVADMARTALENMSLDAAVFCLSLMGANWMEYLREAHRTLRDGGQLFVAEPQGRWRERLATLKDAIATAGFLLAGDVEQRFDFIYLRALKA